MSPINPRPLRTFATLCALALTLVPLPIRAQGLIDTGLL